MQKPYIIAEIGCNHLGKMDIAQELIKIAASFCKVDAVKFQKRNNRELLSHDEYNAPHPNPANSYGETYGLHREYLEFNQEQHKQLKTWSEENGVTYSTSVWDPTSAKEIAALNPEFIKIPSACNLDFDIYNILLDNYSGDIHISLGMTYQNEEDKILDYFQKKNAAKRIVLYACTSGYPVPFEDVSLLEIERISKKFKSDVKAIGFSGHHLGIAVDIAALALGATVFERHFTLDRTWKGTDHAASLEPDGMRRLSRDLRNVAKTLTHKQKEVLDIEEVQRKKLKRKIER